MAKGTTVTSQYQSVFTGEWHVISYAMSREVAGSMVYYPAATHVRRVRKLCKFSFFLPWELCNLILFSILPSYPILREKIVPSCSRYISPLPLVRYLLYSYSRRNFCSIPPSSCWDALHGGQAVCWKPWRTILHKHVWYSAKKCGIIYRIFRKSSWRNTLFLS